MADRPLVAVVLAAMLAVTACSGGEEADELFDGRPGDSAAPTTTATSTTAASTAAGVLLGVPQGTDSATVSAAAEVVRTRLTRMGVVNADVSAESDGVRVVSSADAYQLRAAAQRHATQIVPVTSSTLGPCAGTGVPSAGPAARCYVLGTALTGVGAVTGATVDSVAGTGWKVTFSVDSGVYADFRAALEPALPGPLTLVTDGVVALEFGNGVPALQTSIGPPLAEEQARRAAAALAVDTDSPVDMQAPPEPTPSGARIELDFWTAPLGVDICGTWLANAPTAAVETGVHSHGDGLVYIHPFDADEAGDQATIGLFLSRGGWSATTDELTLWDGTTHTTGQSCPDGQPAEVRWYVDGVEQAGGPATFTPRNGQVIVLSFNSTPPASTTPPQLDSFFVPVLSAYAG